MTLNELIGRTEESSEPLYVIDSDTLNPLNVFSCKIEILRNNLKLLHSTIWSAVLNEDMAYCDQAAALSEALLELADLRNDEISDLVGFIEKSKLVVE